MGRVSTKLFPSRVDRGTHDETTSALPKPNLLLLRVCGSTQAPHLSLSPPFSLPSIIHSSFLLSTRPPYFNLFTLLPHLTRLPSLTMPFLYFFNSIKLLITTTILLGHLFMSVIYICIHNLFVKE